MAKGSTLKRVEADIANGDLGMARDRLHGLIASFPNEVALRSQLAEVYALLRCPDMAGRYWYLDEPASDEMAKAIDLFEKRCGHDPMVMLGAIKFKGNMEILPGHARDRLSCLIERCKKKYGRYPDFSGKRTTYIETAVQKASGQLLAFVIPVIFVLFVACALVGLYAIVTYIW